jgi:hypothetical protein
VSIIRRLRLCRERNHLPAGEAGSIRGKLGWILSAAYARVGRAASQPLTERAMQDGRRGGTDEWTPALEQMLEFYEVLLAVDERGVPRLPPLEVACQRHGRAPVVVYSDAMFHRLVGGAPYGRVAFVIIVAGRRPVVARALTPPWVYSFLSADSHTLIQQLEIAAAVGAYQSCPELLRGEAVLHFVDNTGALSNLIHGYASRPDCGRLVNALHLTLAALQTQTWFEWVPSKENVADVPSREDSDLELIEILEGAGLEGAFDEVEFVFPPIQAWAAPLGVFAAVP